MPLETPLLAAARARAATDRWTGSVCLLHQARLGLRRLVRRRAPGHPGRAGFRAEGHSVIILGLTGLDQAWANRPPPLCCGQLGVPVHDADASVHRADESRRRRGRLRRGGLSGTVRDGAGSTAGLRRRVFADPAELKRLESILHPMVREQERIFLRTARNAAPSTSSCSTFPCSLRPAARRCDAVIVVTAPKFLQDQQVLKRPGMSGGRRVVTRPDCGCGERAARADFVVPTGLGKRVACRSLAHSRRLKRGVIGVFDGGCRATHCSWPPACAPAAPALFSTSATTHAPYGPRAAPRSRRSPRPASNGCSARARLASFSPATPRPRRRSGRCSRAGCRAPIPSAGSSASSRR